MPTGYTSKLHDGEQSWNEFVWECARAFGALVLLRDDHGAPIPQEFKVEAFYAENLAKSEAELKEWLSTEEPGRLAMYESKRRDNERMNEERRVKRTALRLRYEAMLGRAQAWVAPTSEHEGLRKFMIEQLSSSIDFDCSDYSVGPLPPFSEWCHEHTKSLTRSVGRKKESLAKEEARTAQRNAWLKALRVSVPMPAEAAAE